MPGPNIVLLAGPNGAGKTTTAPAILRDTLAAQRVSDRVRTGGHDVPADIVRRRYSAGLRNLFQIYLPLATTWRVYDNSVGLRLIAATGGLPVPAAVHDPALWAELQRSYGQVT
jgi:predicted ABC-type ATPase